MENQHSNLGLNLPSNPPASGTTPLNQFSPYLPPPKPTEVAEPTLWERCSEFLNSKKIIETAIWLILLILFLPSGMAVASWNAVPGDTTYSWKISLEKSLLVVLKPSKKLQTSTQVVLTQRRFAEASKMLKGDQAELGLKNLADQVHTTSDSIQGLAGSSKTEFTMQYIEALTELNQKLEQEKKLHQGSAYKPPKAAIAQKTGKGQPVVNSGSQGQGGTTIIQNTYVQNTIVQNVPTAGGSTVPTIPVAPVDTVTSEIIQTQQEIQETIAELQTQNDVAPIQPTESPVSEPEPESTTIPAVAEPPVQDQAPPVNAPEPRNNEADKTEPQSDNSANENSNHSNQDSEP